MQTGAGNTFTLVSIDEAAVNVVEEVEAKGAVVSSTATQLTIDAGGAMLTFAAPSGVTLPVFAAGTFVEVRGVTINGVLSSSACASRTTAARAAAAAEPATTDPTDPVVTRPGAGYAPAPDSLSRRAGC